MIAPDVSAIPAAARAHAVAAAVAGILRPRRPIAAEWTRLPMAALPTHLHWDHVSGLADLPGLALLARRTEWEWAMAPGPAPTGGVRRAVQDRPVATVALEGPPVLTFERSHDVMGDGSIVLVDLPGHTPGSMGVLLHTEGGWVLLIGDTAWLGGQLTAGRHKLAIPGEWVDHDRNATWTALLRVMAVQDLVRVVPAHDPVCLKPARHHTRNEH